MTVRFYDRTAVWPMTNKHETMMSFVLQDDVNKIITKQLFIHNMQFTEVKYLKRLKMYDAY